jgi:hypothetical protein
MAWAESVQNFVYKVTQNGAEIGHRNVVITYVPSSEKRPGGAKKIEISSDLTLSIGGKSIRYQQKGVGQFSKRRSNFVVSNEVDGVLTEVQGRRSVSGVWTIHTIYDGSFQKKEYSPLQVQNTSLELFLPNQWTENDVLDCLIVDGSETFVVNSVWDKGFSIKEIEMGNEMIEKKLSIKVEKYHPNTVWSKEGYLLGANVALFGKEFLMLLEELPKEVYYGDVKEQNDFSGIQEQDL